ncbi:sushi domain-containing protein 4-like isoform X2 [Littorina saxatilis]|uniref:Sushi domain-containing protein n=1 Tax=Littorina saxatilis TaxID=31220 RepID=A0AAN9BIN3_9CAEN
MGSHTAACQIISTVFSVWIIMLTGVRAKDKDIVEVEASCPDQGMFEHGTLREFVKPYRGITYTCRLGFQLIGNHTQKCGSDGHWIPEQRPHCESILKCKIKPAVLNGDVTLEHSQLEEYDEGVKGTVTCKPGYLSPNREESYRIVCNKFGIWTTMGGSSFYQCQKVNCPPMPPLVPFATYHFESYKKLEGKEQEGLRARYICHHGFELVPSKDESVLTCVDGEWEGPIPTCVRSEKCSQPMSINKGEWTAKSLDISHGFPVGSEVVYSCLAGYRLVGADTLKCTADLLWSKIPPNCMKQTEKVVFCRDIGLSKIDNGYCKCERSESNSLEKCEPFYLTTQVRCQCDQGYKLMGSSLLTCTSMPLARSDYGTWSHEPPYCIREDRGDMEAPVPSDDHRLVNGTRVSTLVIVIASACSVLGVLLLIMVVVVFRRKKPRPRLFHPSVTPPPYSRVHNNVLDEHDRLALMAYADATRVHLPTYDEAMHGRAGGRGGMMGGMVSGNDYRPLPSIPPNLRAPSSVPGGGADNPNRHSIITTSTMNRDGLSENFGSLDTVNVSMSDASTSVTVETFDSGTSNRSISSQRATAGSIASSDDNLANDNAPLLDNSGETCEDNSSNCSTPNLEQKDE